MDRADDESAAGRDGMGAQIPEGIGLNDLVAG
jgi:hypothetical protein